MTKKNVPKEIVNGIFTAFWLHFDCILAAFWLHFECILIGFWLHFDCIFGWISTICLHFGFFLTAFWLHFHFILIVFWLHFDHAFWLYFASIFTQIVRRLSEMVKKRSKTAENSLKTGQYIAQNWLWKLWFKKWTKL